MGVYSVPHTQSVHLPAYKWTGMNGHDALRKKNPPWRSCREKESLCERFVLNKSRIYWEVRRCEREPVWRVWSDCAQHAELNWAWDETRWLQAAPVQCCTWAAWSLAKMSSVTNFQNRFYPSWRKLAHAKLTVWWLLNCFMLTGSSEKSPSFMCLWYSDLYIFLRFIW